ncbi:MAG: family 43 glycosylhydrolase [Clostridia bacterium]|nr:family 43 glycosylhydrolase [Clostridia bacterium]
MNFKPEKYHLGDTWHYSDGENVHAFYMQNISFDNTEEPESGSLGHAISRDMINWQELKPAILRGQPDSYDEMDLWTGCVFVHNGKWYLYYTARPKNAPLANSICLATSDDGINFKKHPENPVIVPDARYYNNAENISNLAVHSNHEMSLVDCRDLHVVRDEEKGIWWGFFAVRRPADECSETSVIGLAKSKDLIHWEQLEPCFCPDKYGCIETPDVFEMNGKWYMLCLSGNEYGQRNRTGDPNLTGRITIWAVADKVEGPYRECTDNALLGAMDFNGICAKTFLHNDKRYLFYTEAFTLADGGIECYHSLPKEVVTDDAARLHLKWFKGIDDLYKTGQQCLSKELSIENTGRWGTIAKWNFDKNLVTVHPKHDYCVQMFDISAKNCVLETTIHRDDCIAAGFIFDVDGDNIFCDNKIAMLDFKEKEVWLTRARNFKKTAARCINLKGDTFRIKVLCYGKTVEVYVNDELYVHHLYERKGGKIGLFADMGKVTFKDSIINVIE